MKKSVLIALLFSIVFLANGIKDLGSGDSPPFNTSNSVEVTLLGPKQYTRTSGMPNIYTDTFPGRVGQGKIILRNGGVSRTDRISSAIIKINGIQIFGTSDFTQNVQLLEKTVGLQEENSISVELRSKPGSFINIQIAQEIGAEAGGVVGTSGGFIEVTDSTSLLYGLKIEIPDGALNKEVLISAEEATNLPPAPSYVSLTSTSFNLLPDGLIFNPDYPVEVTVPYSFANIGPDDFVFVMRYDEPLSEWRDVGQLWIDKGEDKLGIQISHFTPYQVMLSTPNLRSPVDIGFVFDNDKFPRDLVGDFCKGDAVYTNWYWRAMGSGLHCAYSQTIAANIQSQSQSALSNYYDWQGLIDRGENEESIANKLWLGLMNEGKPQLLLMRVNDFSNNIHTIVIFKYEYNSTLDRGYFYFMDPNYTAGPEKLTYLLSSKDILDFAGSSGTYRLFQYKQWDPNTNSILQSVSNQNPKDGVPCPATNLVPNPSFEQGSGLWPDSWERFHYGSGAGNFFWEKNIAKSGTHSAGVTGCNYSDALVWRSTFIPCTLLQRYELRFSYLWSPDSAGDATYYVSCSYYDENFNFLIKWDRFFFNEKNLDWTNIAWTFTPYGRYPIKYLRLEFGLIGRYSSFNATFWIDDVEVRIIK
jgi:hypothetical protein